MVSDGGKKNDGMRRDELNRMACGWLVHGGSVAEEASQPWESY